MMLARPGSYWFGRTAILTPVGAVAAYVPGSANPFRVRQPSKVVTSVVSWRQTAAAGSPKSVLSLHRWSLTVPRFHTIPPAVKLYSVFPVTVAVAQAPIRHHPPTIYLLVQSRSWFVTTSLPMSAVTV